MKKFILLTFALLGWSFYEMSGGAEFQVPVQSAEASTMQAKPESESRDILARARPAPEQTPADLVAEPSLGTDEAQVEKAVLEASLTTKSDVTRSAPAEETTEATAEETAAPAPPLVEVAGDRVNLREGPGTTNPVIVTLDGGTEAERLESRDGWAHIRITETGQEGWMAERLLTGI